MTKIGWAEIRTAIIFGSFMLTIGYMSKCQSVDGERQSPLDIEAPRNR